MTILIKGWLLFLGFFGFPCSDHGKFSLSSVWLQGKFFYPGFCLPFVLGFFFRFVTLDLRELENQFAVILVILS